MEEIRISHSSSPRIFYYTPDHNVPSWGIGMLYTHVRLLRSSGIPAFVLHDRYPFRPHWLQMNVSREYLDRRSFQPRPRDIVVIPEIVADGAHVRAYSKKRFLNIGCRRVVFVQGSSLIMAGLGSAQNYRELGYEGAIAVMPHIQAILERHFSTSAAVVPPCVAPYFLADRLQISSSHRKRQIVLVPKMGCEDYEMMASFLRSRLPGLGWRLIELKDKSHRQVARVMQESAFHLNVNCQESFNATVPEAMAAGCIPICYEAFGGRDFLEDGKNAYVFPNHHIFPLLERTLELVQRYDRMQSQLTAIRRAGWATARRFSERQTMKALLSYFRPMLRV